MSSAAFAIGVADMPPVLYDFDCAKHNDSDA